MIYLFMYLWPQGSKNLVIPDPKTHLNRTLSRSFHLLVIYNTMMATVSLQAITPFCLSVALHLGLFIHGEWHIHAGTIFLAHAIVFTLLLSKQLVSALPTWYGVVLPFLVYLCGLLGSVAVYRLFFHRLRFFPGPRLAALSKLWHVWLSRNSQSHLVLDSWRQKYGAFVRTGQYSPRHQAHVLGRASTDFSPRSG